MEFDGDCVLLYAGWWHVNAVNALKSCFNHLYVL